MKKRILSFFCVLALCLTLLPATAWAAEEYDFKVETTPVNFGSVSFVTVANAKKTVLITNTGTENIIVRVKQNEANFKYFVLDATSWSQEYQFKINGIGYYEATVAPNESVHVDIEIKFTNLTDASADHYEETIHIPIYQKDGSTSIKPSFIAAFDWVEAKQEMEVTPASLNLGTVGQGYGDTQPVTFTIKNTGDLELDSVSCDLSFDGDQDANEKYYVTNYFKLTPNIFIPVIGGDDIYPLSLGVGESETIGVYVKQGLPQGTYTATLVVRGYNYDSGEYVYASIPLTFTVGAARYGISADPATLDFGTAGLSNTQAEARTVTITNTGNTVDTINLPSADNFEITAGDGFSGNTATISQGRTASFTVRPEANLSEDTYNTAITVTNTNNASTMVNLQFQVERKDCDLMADVSQLDFGYAQEGYGQPEGKTVTLTNVGKNTLTVSLPTAEGYVVEGGYGFTGGTATIEPDATASFTVRPATGLEGGSHPATLTITGSAAGQTASWPVALSFSVEPKTYEASVSPETVTFEGLRVGYEQSEAQTVTVTNTGNQTLRLELPSLENYEIQPVTGFDGEGVASLAAINGTASFTVRPAADLAQGDHSATLTLKLTSDDPDQTVTKEVALNCNIDETALEARPASFDFGTAQGSNYQVAEQLTVTISVKSGVNGEYKIKIPANDPVFIFEPRDNFVLDEDGQFYTGTVKRVNGNVTQIAAFYLSVRNDLSPGNYDRELDLGCGLTLPLRFTVEALPYEITVSPQQLNFGTIVSGVDETPAAQTLTVTNTGINNITVNLPSGTNYVVTGGEGFEDGKAALESGAAASFTVRPVDDLAAEDYEEFLSITTDQSDVSKEILLSFAVEDPDYTINCDQDSLNFSAITVDETPPEAQTVTITNEGNVTNTVSLPQSDAFDLTGSEGFEDGTAVLEPEETATFTVRPKASLSADDYSGTLTLSGSGDSEVSIEVSYVVEKGQAVVTKAPTAKTLTYNGSAQPLVTAGEATGGTLMYRLGDSGEFSAEIPAATDAGKYSVWYYVKGDDNHNNTEPSGSVTVTIAKANYDGTTGVSGAVLANYSGEVTLPDIPDGASYGTPTSSDVTSLSITDGVLHYTGGSGIVKGQTYTVTVPVNGGKNYNNYEITVTLTGTDKQVLNITGITAQDGTYNGQAQTGYTGSPAADGYDGDFTVTYGTTDGQAPTDAGTYTVTIAIPDSDPQYVGSTTLDFTIAKKALIVSAPSASVYVGDNAPELVLTYTGLVDGESVTPSDTPTFTITKSDNTEITLADAVKTAGTYTITWSNEGITTFPNGTNYDITKNPAGTLKVSNRPVTPAPTPSGPSTGGSDGWTEIEDEVDETPSGSTVTVDMNGTTEVPAEVFEAVAGKDVTLELDMGGGVKWEINGQDIPTDLDFTDLDMGVSLNTSDIPVDVINMVTGEKSTVQLSLAHDGEFGFTLTLTAPVGTENKGLWANLYHYNTTKKQMLFETSAQVDSSGNVALKFTHASEYAIVLDESSHELPFTDTAKGAWYQGAVEYVYRNGIMTGTSATTFSPNTAMNRAMVAQILYNLEGQPTVTGESTFTDSNTHWAAKAIAWAQKTGVVSGYGNNTFRPNQAVTREELAQMLYNYAEYKQYDLTASGDLIAFPDGNNVQGWAKTAMSWANGNQLINGFEDDTLWPGGDSTRAQAASILMNFDLNVVKD